MHEAISKMLAKYDCRRLDDYVHALREILQEVALLGLWRAKFFEKAAFYGGTALRILYGLDRFSEDLDFSLLTPMADFDLGRYTSSLQKEIEAFGFDVWIEKRDKAILSPIQSAFLKADTRNQLLVIEAGKEIVRQLPKGQLLRIRLEVDTDPPSGFTTHTRYLLQPIPFAVRVFVVPDLFAGKLHAVLCRRWKSRVKGRDWYDLIWYAANHPDLNLYHLEQRMRQTGDWQGKTPLTSDRFRLLMEEAVKSLDVDQARRDVIPFTRHPDALAVWSRDFFRDVADRIRFVES
ncbi:MAG: nucleotidyl transferase AbiEii/AbiGii toxin family protein [Desulfobacterales bacterium]|uniref:Nucleotidyl transferase AbiEii/AbiGii toxin family protein n=1 Tax=Candidatus Desulfatibia vada TaxID=2841696 RepID=A0A8J6P0W2_9BACT|nr:nucleotidyl transferase AbiEii/AbiGii toxin family protein [Candidatus Desulfatibia vada]MBL6972678.1 nucleotidyl transferase AbiEii/AbiGii toxin family protein [Desulfobacterales bacterium]